MKIIDGASRKREATLESAVWQATSRKNEKWRTPAITDRHISRRTSATLVLRAQHDQRNGSIAT